MIHHEGNRLKAGGYFFPLSVKLLFCSRFRPSTVPQKNSEPFNNLIINAIKARTLIAAAAT